MSTTQHKRPGRFCERNCILYKVAISWQVSIKADEPFCYLLLEM